MGSCKKCSMKCLLIHGKKDSPDPVVSSFVKVMFHDRFLDFMYIPPRFAREIASLANKEIQVEDKSGRRWTVLLSYVDGCLSFSQGWHDFALDYGIKLGDLVIVHYVGSHFVAQIYGRSGCEKLFPSAPQSNQGKRAKPSSSVDNSSSTSSSVVEVKATQGNKEGSSKAQPDEPSRGLKRKFVEDPCCIIIDRDIASTPKADNRTFFDLSEFESYKKINVSGNDSLPKQDSACADHGEREEQVYESSSFFGEDMIDYAAFEAAMKIPCGNQENDSSKHGEISGKVLQECCPSVSAVIATECKTQRAGVSPPEAQTAAAKAQTTTLEDQAVVKKCKELSPKGDGVSVRIAETVHKDLRPKGFGNETSQYNPVIGRTGRGLTTVKKDNKEFNPKSTGGSESVKLVKKEPKEINPKSSGVSARLVKKEFMENDPQNLGKKCNPNESVQENRASVSSGLLKQVKAEVVDVAEPPARRRFTCLVASDDSLLELPKNFSVSRCRRAMEVENMVLHLRDSNGRVWPVLYYKRMGMKVVTVGWGEFREANKIRTGDECVLGESDTESVYEVHVNHN